MWFCLCGLMCILASTQREDTKLCSDSLAIKSPFDHWFIQTTNQARNLSNYRAFELRKLWTAHLSDSPTLTVSSLSINSVLLKYNFVVGLKILWPLKYYFESDLQKYKSRPLDSST